MIEIKQVSYSFDEKIVLDRLNLKIPDNCIFGLTGINGAGKSTLMRIMCGVYKPKTGSILYDGDTVFENEECKKSIFFLPDDPYYTLTTTGRSLYEMYKVFYPKIDKGYYEDLVLNKFKLELNKPIHKFSKGMRRQIFIAIGLAVKPKYFILDEAFDGLDPLKRMIFRREVVKHCEQMDMTVIISSHALRELECFCDRYAMLDNKTVKSSGEIDEIVTGYCKFQLAFSEEKDKSDFSKLPVVYFSKQGKFITIILNGSGDDMLPKLKTIGAVVIEELPIGFEEMFICQADITGGDIL